jgi:two-component system, NarL family, response regulator NreC
MTRVFIIDDHEMYLEGLSLLLQKQLAIEVTGTSGTAMQLMQSLPDISPDDVLLLDVNLPDMEEEELIKKIRAIRPKQKVIYITLIRGTRYVHKLLKYNVQGYILKNARVDELVNAIKTVGEGGTFFSKEIDVLSDRDFRNTLTVEDKQVTEILSKREVEVLKLVCKEFSNAEIAKKLFLSVSTVETHRKNLIAKLGVQNTVGLVKFAIRNNLID